MNAKKILTQYKNTLNKREPNLWVFGAWNGDKFADNPKYFFLYCLKKKQIDAIWITKNRVVYEYMRQKGYPVEMHDSKTGIEVQKKAGVAVYCLSTNDLNQAYIGGALLINLWHGIPLKKIGYDDHVTQTDSAIKKAVRAAVHYLPYKNTFIVTTSKAFQTIYASAFHKPIENIIKAGQPRNDMFFDNRYSCDYDFSFLKRREAIVYMPTHRNEGKTPISVPKLFDLEKIDRCCEKNNCVFIIKKHYYHKDEDVEYAKKYSNIIDLTRTDIDAQELLKHASALITDYSSCYIDYLLLNRPIFFYNYDYAEYLQKDRQMYFDYETVTPGKILESKDEMTNSLCDWIKHGEDEMEEKRQNCLDLFYDGHSGPVSDILFAEIRNIQKGL